MKPEEIEFVVPLIVEMMTQYNERMAAKTTIEMREGEQTFQAETAQSSSDMKSDKGKGEEREGQESSGKANTNTVVTPIRGYKDSSGNDHGKAMREQLLNPRPDPGADI